MGGRVQNQAWTVHAALQSTKGLWGVRKMVGRKLWGSSIQQICICVNNYNNCTIKH